MPSFNETMNTILPAQNGYAPHITGNYGEIRTANSDGRKLGPHGGVDFNYANGSGGINTKSPTIYSPIDGVVTDVKAGLAREM